MRCASSVILTAINTCRNPQGREENWSYPIEYISIFNIRGVMQSPAATKLREVQLIKAMVGQVACLVVLGAAGVETVAYTALVAISLIFYRYTDAPCTFSMNLLSSSLFTIVRILSKIEHYWLISINQPGDWVLSSQARKNRAKVVLVINAVIAVTTFFFGMHMLCNDPTHESFARQKIAPDWFLRDEDKSEIIRRFLPNAADDFIQHCIQNDTIWRDLMRLLDTLPSLLENRLSNLDRAYRQPPTVAATNRQAPIPVASIDEDEDGDYTYVCTITMAPLVDPVQDPTAMGENPVLYEREAIKRWLNTNRISPVTRHPLRISELIKIEQMSQETRKGIRDQQAEIARRREERATQAESA